MSVNFFKNWAKKSIAEKKKEDKEQKEDDEDVHNFNIKHFKEMGEKLEKGKKIYENFLKNKKPEKRTLMTTRKIVYNEPHKEKIKEIEDYMKTFNFDNDKHKVNYYDSLHKNKEIKSKIKNAKKNYNEALQYKNILEEQKKKSNNNEFSEVIKLLQKALEKGTHTKVLQNALKYIKKFK